MSHIVGKSSNLDHSPGVQPGLPELARSASASKKRETGGDCCGDSSCGGETAFWYRRTNNYCRWSELLITLYTTWYVKDHQDQVRSLRIYWLTGRRRRKPKTSLGTTWKSLKILNPRFLNGFNSMKRIWTASLKGIYFNDISISYILCVGFL